MTSQIWSYGATLSQELDDSQWRSRVLKYFAVGSHPTNTAQISVAQIDFCTIQRLITCLDRTTQKNKRPVIPQFWSNVKC